ncbi:MAG: hypothetical protein J6T35_05640 [Bacteroidales bacterium]|nr:hypothetical protein [Bacteroidales bacterium]
MKAQDLMLGDYVTFRDCDKEIVPIMIMGIPYDSAVYGRIGRDVAFDEIDVEDLAGIPITPEILEKNGFVYSDLPFEQSWQQFGLSLYRGGDSYLINCGENVAIIIDYVHQLQHALRLCGIEKEIEL